MRSVFQIDSKREKLLRQVITPFPPSLFQSVGAPGQSGRDACRAFWFDRKAISVLHIRADLTLN
jgi:hypothetical protein